jgi:fibronectin-binding autotransporter adhesin
VYQKKNTKLVYSDGTNIVDAGFSGGTDLDGNELILDADADTSITADTDDQIDIKIAGADDFQFTANTFTAQSGSSIVVPEGGLTFGSTAITSTAAELNLLDGVSGLVQADLTKLAAVDSTAAELNIVDGGTSATSTTVADADRVVLNDNGTMVQVAVTDLAAYFDDEITAMPNLTSVGTLTTLTVDSIIINGTNIGHTSDADAIAIASNGNVTISQNLTVTGDITVSGDDITMGTNTAGNLLIADGTNFNSIAVGSLSEISTVANDDVFLAVDTSGGGLKKIARSAVVSGLATSGAISNVVEDTSPQLGGDLDVNSNGLVSTSNGNIALTPNGTGVVRIDGSNGIDMQSGAISIKNSGAQSYVRFYCESSNAHYAQLQAPAHSAFSGNITLTLPATTDTVAGIAATQNFYK